jgi:hypothetical protein
VYSLDARNKARKENGEATMIIRRTHLSVLLVIGIFTCLAAFAQQAAETAGAVPPLVNFASTLTDINSKPIVGVTGRIVPLDGKPDRHHRRKRTLLRYVRLG